MATTIPFLPPASLHYHLVLLLNCLVHCWNFVAFILMVMSLQVFEIPFKTIMLLLNGFSVTVLVGDATQFGCRFFGIFLLLNPVNLFGSS